MSEELKNIAIETAQNGLASLSPNMSSEIPTKEEIESLGGVLPEENNPSACVIVDQYNNSSANNIKVQADVGEVTPSLAGLEGIENVAAPSIAANPFKGELKPPTNINELRQEQIDILNEIAPDMPEDEKNEKCIPIINKFESIMEDLIVNFGLTPEKAKTGAVNRIKNELRGVYEEYKQEHPDVGVITIDKSNTDINDLALSADEHAKLERVKKIRLIMVEDTELANITIERPDEKHLSDYVKTIEGSVPKYSVPLPMLGDFVTFKGAQIIQMVNIINYEDARIDEIINTKASLVYDKLIGGAVLKKTNENSNSIMSYNEFINKFPYNDLDIAIYAITCASSPEESSTSLTCQHCQHTWNAKYNTKNLLKLETITDSYKQRVEDILKNKSNAPALMQLFEERRKARRYKSPFTNNVYDMSYPTIARAIDLLKRINTEDTVMNYLSAVGLYISRILLYNPAKNSYIEINSSNTDVMLDVLQTLTNDDVNMLATQIREDLQYRASFEIDAECPSCHAKNPIPINIENLIFLMARDSLVEITD